MTPKLEKEYGVIEQDGHWLIATRAGQIYQVFAITVDEPDVLDMLIESLITLGFVEALWEGSVLERDSKPRTHRSQDGDK